MQSRTVLLTPSFVSLVVLKSTTNQDILQLQQGILQLVNNINTDADQPVTSTAVLTTLQTTMGLLADALKLASTLVQDPEMAGHLTLYASILSAGSDVVAMAANHDWVSMVKDVANTIAEADKHDDALTRSAKFVTLLASMYPANRWPIAGASSRSSESISSRTTRFFKAPVTVDIAAMVGGLGNYQWVNAQNAAPGHAHDGEGWSGGLYAPFGLQLGFPYFGILVYPLISGLT